MSKEVRAQLFETDWHNQLSAVPTSEHLKLVQPLVQPDGLLHAEHAVRGLYVHAIKPGMKRARGVGTLLQWLHTDWVMAVRDGVSRVCNCQLT